MVGVWCAVSQREIICPIFFHETMNSGRYFNDTLNPFFNQMTEEERQYGYFQQDNATAHTANATMVAIREAFKDRIISRGLRPPRSPDLSFCDFYLRGNKNITRSNEALHNEITRVIGSMTVGQLQKVLHHLLMRCESYLQAEVGYFHPRKLSYEPWCIHPLYMS
jgi:hypothetical protein